MAVHDVPVKSAIVPNPYRDDIFRRTNDGPRPIELAFVGRLVSDKGVAVLLAALGRLQTSGLSPRLRLILTGLGLRIVVLDLSEFHKGGGSARCLTNPLDFDLSSASLPGGEVILPS